MDCRIVDNNWGPYAGQTCRGGFDFTQYFEETILAIVPLACFLILALIRAVYLLRVPSKLISSRWRYGKLGCYICHVVVHAVSLAIWLQSSSVRTKATVATSALSLLGAIALGLLSYIEHSRSIRPSSLLQIYLLLTVILGTARVRTLWLQSYNRNNAILLTVALVLNLLALGLETKEKGKLLKPRYSDSPPEASAGVFNRWFFWWENSLFRKGFSHDLEIEDLFMLDRDLLSEKLYRLLQGAWLRRSQPEPPIYDFKSFRSSSGNSDLDNPVDAPSARPEVAQKGSKLGANTLFKTSIRTFAKPLLLVVPYRAALIAFQFCQPLLINRAIRLAQEPINDHTTQIGYGLIGAYFIVYIGIAVTTGQQQHLSYRSITMARGGLISMLYSKAVKLKSSGTDSSSSLTLMSADIERITQGWQTMHDLWANIIEVVLAIYLLEQQLGAACALPIGIAIVSLFGSAAVTGLVIGRQKAWLEAIERRISATTTMLGSMKSVKLSGLTYVLSRRLQELRREEMEISKGFRKLMIYTMGLTYITPVAAPILTFAVFSVLARNSGSGATLDTAKVFTSLSLFTLLSEPLQSFMMALTTFMGSIGSFDRIQSFLMTKEHRDYRVLPRKNLSIMDSAESSPKISMCQSSDLGTDFSTEKLDLSFLPPKTSAYSTSPDAVIIHQGYFGWEASKEGVMRDVNLKIPREKVTMLVGPVGCGKSTLVKAILGELPFTSGIVQISSTSIAYCDQTAWHMNMTIAESIVGVHAHHDESWYTEVIKACALEDDFRQLPKGDQTTIGSKGVALSGGQSQRIALARAIYAQKEILILDDVFSSLDQTTEDKVFHSLLGKNGVLRRNNTTVIFASSSVKRVPYADHIVSLGSNGSITEAGPFEQLQSSSGYIASFNLSSPDWKHNTSRSTDKQHPTKNMYQKDAQYGPDVPQSPQTETARRTGDVSVYAYYIRAIGYLPTLVFISGIVIFVFCYTFPNIWVKWWAAANAEDPNGNLGYWLGIYAAIGVAAVVALILACWQMIITMVPKSGVAFHEKLLGTVLNAPMRFFSTTDTGVTLNRFSQDLQLIDMDLPVTALNAFTTLVFCLAQMIMIGIASSYAAISFPICLIALFFIQKFYLRTSRQLRFLDLEAKSPLYSEFVECISGLATIRAFSWQEDLQTRLRGLLDRSQRPFYLLFAVQRWITLVLDLMVAAIAVILIILVVELRGKLSAGYVGVALLNVIMFSQYIKLLVVFWTMLETNIGAIARIKSFTKETANEHQSSEDRKPPSNWPSQGAIEFRDVSASYDPPEKVIDDISMIIEPGQKVAICGRTGSGKSSLIMTLFRMIDQTDGSVYIDGLDISTLPRQTLRQRLVGVPQDAYLFPGTVEENAAPFGGVEESEIIDALECVQLWDVITEKGGLNADIDDCHFSQGQKQLFCLARAILRPGRVVVLDEALSSIDARTEAIIQNLIRSKFVHHTVIVIAHKLESILDFDRVALMEHGKIREYDAPHELLSQPDSKFAELYNSSQQNSHSTDKQ